MKVLRVIEPQAYAMFRMVTGFLMFWHGAQKVFGFPGDGPALDMPWHIAYVAGPLELLGGLVIALGLFTRPAAFLCSGLMASAYWMAHGTRAVLPIDNGGELAALYCFAFLFIATRGPGIWSLSGKD